ncbi:hypothetical protein MIR68_012387 [Amoeboaphelidium protococcarum]|nr:hypothetical protein MIR68_012387 [Amoeboaphelidium protococcarum]
MRIIFSCYCCFLVVLPLIACTSNTAKAARSLPDDAFEIIGNWLDADTLRNTRLSSHLLRKVSDVRAGELVNDLPNLQRYGFYSLEYAIASAQSPFIVSLVGKTYESNLLNYKLMLAVDRAFGFGQIQTRPGLPDINGKDVNAMIIRTIIQLPGADYKVLRFPLKRKQMVCNSEAVEWILSLDIRIKEEFAEEFSDIQTRCDASGALNAANVLSELNRQFEESVISFNIKDMEKYLLQGASIETGNGFALRRASYTSNLPIIRILLSYGANVNRCSPPLIAQQANYQTFRILVQYGLDLYQHGDACLINASGSSEQFPVVRYLIQSYRDSLSQQAMDSALIEAAKRGNSAIFEFLKQHGAKESIECNTALLRQSYYGVQANVQNLISLIRFPPAIVWEAIEATSNDGIRQMLTQYLNDYYTVRSDVDISAE